MRVIWWMYFVLMNGKRTMESVEIVVRGRETSENNGESKSHSEVL
jgi:hypothetical protein